MRRWVVVVIMTAVVAGCSTSARDLPLPGRGVSGPTYRIDAVFDDALNLAEGAPVKVNGVTVGRVHDVRPDDFTARARLDIRTSAALHAGATARLRSTTPLGELFVQIDDSGDGQRLTDGARLGRDSTSEAPTIEDTMTAASLVINGGGLGQLQTIVREANRALGGHESSARDLIGRLARTARALNDSRDDIDATLDAMADLSTTLNHRRTTITAALEDVAPAARVLRENTDELADLLRSIDDLGGSATSVIDATRDDLLRTLRRMGPVFDELNSLRSDLGPGIDTLVRFAGLIDSGVPTDFLNTYLHFQGQLSLGLPGSSTNDPRLVTPDPDSLLPGLTGSAQSPSNQSPSNQSPSTQPPSNQPPSNQPPSNQPLPSSGGSSPLGRLFALFGGGR